MKGDFTRVTFDVNKHYSRVLQQQGRVQLDADQNEATEIQLHFLRTLAADLIGPHGGPGDGFKIGALKDESNNDVLRDFGVAGGHYYVNGILCENDEEQIYTKQSGFPTDSKLEDKTYVAYLDVWERHVAELEDQDENTVGIREVALRGPDTATRTKVVWQVKTKYITDTQKTKLTDNNATYQDFLTILGDYVPGTGLLRARAITPAADDEPCLIAPSSRYRGPENQLYRVEIHRGGVAWDGIYDGKNKPAGNWQKAATFKWSRENGSVIFGIKRAGGKTIVLDSLGYDTRFGLRRDDWIEIVDDDYVLQNRAEPLLQIDNVDKDNLTITLKNTPASQVGTDPAKHPLVRRWDHRVRWFDGGALLVSESSGDEDSDWITLEDGVQIQFPPPAQNAAAHVYRTGDYWLVPARVATGDVEWPGRPGYPAARPPNGIRHYYAPLGIFSVASTGKIDVSSDLRRSLTRP